MHPDTCPDRHANHVSRQDSSAVPDGGRSPSACSESTLFVSSPGALEGEQAPSESTCGAADNRKRKLITRLHPHPRF